MYKSCPINSKKLEERADLYSEGWATKNSEAKRDITTNSNSTETYRTNFRRDRDRILYAKGFRRLQYKTQVFENHSGDHHRTRLTHTLEVQQLATSISDALQANRDLAEAIAVGHDIGHTPFGHAVEGVLSEKLTNLKLGGFSHAVQSIRYVEHLDKHDGQEGLGLCIQVREGIIKHDSDLFFIDDLEKINQQSPCDHLSLNKPGSIEAQIVYWADKIAYLSHDWDDFVCSGLKDEAIKEGIFEQKDIDNIWKPLISDYKPDFELRDLIRNLTDKLINNTYKTLKTLKLNSSNDFIKESEKRREKIIELSKDTKEIDKKKIYQKALLVNYADKYLIPFLNAREFIKNNFLNSPTVQRMDEKAKLIAGSIFDAYSKNHKLLPLKTQETIKEKKGIFPPERIIADHIACMTDRYASKIYKELFLP